MLNKQRSNGRSRVGKTVGALAAILALSAVLSSNASAFEVTPTAWYTGAYPGTKLVGTEAATLAGNGEFRLYGAISGAPIVIRGRKTECVGCVIENSGSSAVIKGRLKVTELSMEGIGDCSIQNTFIETKPLVGTVASGPPSWTLAFRWMPQSGETWAAIEVGGVLCPVSNLYKLMGYAVGESAYAMNKFTHTHEFYFSARTGGELKFGEERATLNTAQTVSLVSGKEFGIEEK